MRFVRITLAAIAFALAIGAPVGSQVLWQGFNIPTSPSCSSSILDANAASPGAWTAAYSLRKLKAAYAGSAIQLERSSDSATQDIGFSGCDPNTVAPASFCTTATLSVGTSSSRVAFPSGSVIKVFNAGPSGVFYAAGNGSVTATVSSTPLPNNQGASITVGANTNLAAIGGTGYGLNGNAPSATVFLTNCGVSKVYDQQNSNDLAPVSGTQAGMLGYVPASITGGKPVLSGCLTCGMKAADDASYKTATVNTFTVMTFGEDYITANFNYGSVIYPSTSTSAASTSRWGLVNWASPDILTPTINASNGSTSEGFGGIWRGQNLTQYDYSTGGITRWNGGTQFFNAGSGTPTYPNAVGLYVMGDAAGNGTPGMFAEALVASGTQTARNTVSANQVSYWGITTGTAASVVLTNPLGDGWNFDQMQIGSFAPIGSDLTINGNAYATESSWNDYAEWHGTNGSTSSGQLGDLMRFQITGEFDNWDGTFRSELDGAGGGAQFANGTTYWISYAVLVEPGTAYNSQWNINGQMHLDEGTAVCCVFNTMSNTNSGCTDCWTVFTYNATTGSQTSSTSSFSFTRNRWYHFVYQVNVSTSGTADTFNVWLDTVTEGVMVQIASNTGATLFGGSTSNQHTYWKYGIYRQTGVPLPTWAIRYGNMEVCSASATCTTLYGVSDLSARTTTPKANPAHLFLLKRDVDPASNDNSPMWLNEAA